MESEAPIELFRRYPQLQGRLAHLPLADLPTPVERLGPLGEAIGVPGLWIKRDDKSGELYGGNKVRKLEFLLADAIEQGHDRVWTVGAIGSHHCLATAIYAREHGLTPGILHYPQPVTEHVLKNLRALSTTAPDLELVGIKALPGSVLKARVKDWLRLNPEEYYIPGGGSSPVGALGYVNAALELARQVEEGALPEPDFVVVAAGTCGTLAGLTLGIRMAGLRTHVLGVRVVDRVLTNVPVVLGLTRRTATMLREAGISEVPEVESADFTILQRYFGRGYGEPTPEGRRAVALARQYADITLEPTYTGKAFAAIMGERDRMALTGRTILYWHTLSSASLDERIERADVLRDLPPEYRAFFDEFHARQSQQQETIS